MCGLHVANLCHSQPVPCFVSDLCCRALRCTLTVVTLNNTQTAKQLQFQSTLLYPVVQCSVRTLYSANLCRCQPVQPVLPCPASQPCDVVLALPVLPDDAGEGERRAQDQLQVAPGGPGPRGCIEGGLQRPAGICSPGQSSAAALRCTALRCAALHSALRCAALYCQRHVSLSLSHSPSPDTPAPAAALLQAVALGAAWRGRADQGPHQRRQAHGQRRQGRGRTPP